MFHKTQTPLELFNEFSLKNERSIISNGVTVFQLLENPKPTLSEFIVDSPIQGDAMQVSTSG